MIDQFKDEYAFLSNFYPVMIYDFENEIIYPSVEHAFQANKTISIEVRKIIAMLPTPGKAKRAGQLVVLRDDWEKVRVDIMGKLLLQKFNNGYLQGLLMSTKPHKLVECNEWHDNFWGVCICARCAFFHKGENTLGKLLMEIRDK